MSGAELHKKVKFFSRFFGPYALRRLSKIYMPIGKRVVIIGGGLHGCELGEFLTKRGRIVTIVEKADKFGDGMIEVYRSHLMYWFEKKGVKLIGGVKEYVEITDKGLTIVDREGKRQTIQADTFVPALPLTAEHGALPGPLKKGPRGLRHRRLQGARPHCGCNRDGLENSKDGIGKSRRGPTPSGPHSP